MLIGPRQYFPQLTFRVLAPSVETSTLETLYSGKFTSSTPVIKPNHLITHTLIQHLYNLILYTRSGLHVIVVTTSIY